LPTRAEHGEPLAGLAGRLAALAEAEAGREACGLVVRSADGRLEAWPLPNQASDPGRGYEIPPDATLAALARLDRDGLELVAVYHSHLTGGADLSARDIAGAVEGGQLLLPGVEHVVIALERGRAVRIRGHRYRDGGFEGRDLWPLPA
jgi:proteasome lid subunit RPN8/RPN11